MKKLTAVILLFISFQLFGQNPKTIVHIPGQPNTAVFSWACNGLQFYQDYLVSTNNTQIWRTDGTANGTFPLTNFSAGTFVYTDTKSSAVVGNIFYFSVYPPGAPGYEIWKSDGTLNGTVQVNISPITIQSGYIIANSTHLFLTTYSPYEDLYSIDNSGQVTYLARLKESGYYNSLNEGHAAIFRDKLVVVQSKFNTQGNQIDSQDFFITDGTVLGSYTQTASLPVPPRQMTPCGDNFLLMLLPNYPYPNNSLAKLPGVVNAGIGDLDVFYTGISGDDLKDYNYHSSSPYGITNGLQTFQGNATIGNSIFLSGHSDNQGWELWKTDGTSGGTVLVKDIYPGIGSGFDNWNGFVINDKFIFNAYTLVNGSGRRMIFYSNGITAETNFFPQLPVSNDPSIRAVIYYNNKAYFRSLDNSGILSLWQTDGSLSNTLSVTPYDISLDPHLMPFGTVASGNILYKSNNNIIALNPNYKLWNGSADNNWNNAANWENNIVPSADDDVLIPGSAPNYPGITSNLDVHSLWVNSINQAFTCNNNLNISGDLSFSIYNTLNGSGNINFSGTNNHAFAGSGTIQLPINITGGDVYNVSDNKTLSQLNFQSANKFYLGNYNLTMSQTNGITGATIDRFIITDGTGTLRQTISTGAALFPIGSGASSYTPVSVTNFGNMLFSARVIDGAYSNYNTSLPETPTGNATVNNGVNKTWFINTVGGGAVGNPSVQFQWNTGDELPGFNRNNMKAGHYSSGNWTYSANGMASGNNPYTFTYNNVPGFSPFTLISDQLLIRYYSDDDGDGYGNIGNYTDAYSQPSGFVSDSSDCNDDNASITSSATEIQNGIDDNCDGQVDEGLITTNQFIFLKGSATDFSIGSYGIQGIAGVGNNPGKRRYQTTWQYNGKMYMFGGEGYAGNNGNPPPGGYINDLWEYDPATNNWRWLKGSSTLGGAAVYGTKGVAAATNTPGARKNAMGWVLNNKFYLFGGYNGGRVCDLWEYDPATNNWTWIAGDNSSNSTGSYGTLGVAASTNLPPGREQGATWIYNGRLYLFSGIRSNGSNDVQMNDLWQYDFSSGWWTWIGGSNLTNQFGIYGTQGIPSASNLPGSRSESGFAMIGNMTYIYGGTGLGASNGGILSDLWQYDNLTGNWTWLMGSTANDEFKVPGTQGIYNSANTPGARTGCNVTVQNSTLYLYGGFNQFFGGSFQSDLWQYDPSLNQWRWLKGTTGAGTIGNYGFQTVESSSNLPGGRGQGTFSAIGSNIYLFGGRGYSGISSASDESQNDLWKLNTTNTNWTWLKGNSGKQYYGEYGTKGVASSTNQPGGRVAASSIGANGKYYLFGGQANTTYPNFGTTNDLWEFDPPTGNWKWLKGSNVNGSAGNYGTIGVSSPTNEPPFRTSAMMWNIGSKIYMFGGTIGANFNDLWEYDITTNSWTWLKGSNLQNQSGVYGTKGVSSSSNTPGARWLSSAFTYNNKLYLFGGNGYNSGGTTGELNDLWEYDPATNNWTWIGGNDAINSFGIYGTINVASASNIPGGRESGQIQTIGNKAYLFGGRGYASSGGFQNLNDTWEYDFATNQWKWVKGLSTGGNSGVAGSYGIEDPANYPIARYYATSWTLSNKLYIFSGTPFGPEYNDLWEYNPATNNWRYIKGRGNLGNTPANYGLQGIANQNNLPSIRWQSTAAASGNSAYIFGGLGGFANSLSPNSGTVMNDLWKWVSGPVFLYGNERKIYVNDNNLTGDTYTTAVGNNQNPGTASAPLATLDFAVSVAQPGDTIYIDAGTYVTPNITINKALTILGPNYTINVNDATNHLLYNTGRHAEAVISNSTITIASSNIDIEGLTFDPQSKTQFQQTNSTLDFSNILIASSRFFISSNLSLINMFGKNVTPLSSINYFILNNRFEKTAGAGNNTILLSFVNVASISGNVFTISSPSLARVQFAINIGSSGKVDNLTIAGNIFDRYNGTITTTRFGATLIDDNKVYDCQSGFNLSNSISEPAIIRVTRNLLNNIRSGPISYNRTSTNDNSSPNKFICEDNTVNLDATGQTPLASSVILSTVQSTVLTADIETTIKRNRVNYTGDFTATPNFSILGLRFAGRHTNILIDSNEINLTGTNIPQALATASTGVLIFTHPGNVNGVIPANAIINIKNNIVQGFKQSVTFNYAPTSGYGGLLSENTSINYNSFTGDSVSLNFGTDLITANLTCNWYGTLRQDSLMMKVKTGYTFLFQEPWLTTGTDTDPVTVGFQPAEGSCNGHRFEVTDIDSYIIDCHHPDGGMIEADGLNGVAPYTYVWTSDADPQFLQTTARIENLPPATYKVVATDAIGNKDSIEIGVYAATPIAAIVTKMNDVLCNSENNGKAYITVTAIDFLQEISWSNGSTTDTAENLSPGRYYVTVTDGNGCTYLDSVDITEPDLLSVTLTGTNASCNGSATATPSGGTAPYTYSWSNGTTTQTISGVPHGTYSVTVTDANGCMATDTYTITGSSPINPTATAINVSCFGGSDGSIAVTGAGGTAPHTYSINGSVYQSSNIFANLPAGTYVVGVKDATGCIDFVTKNVTQPISMTVVLDSIRTACFGASNGKIYITASGGNGGKMYGWTGPNGFTSTAQDPNNIAAGTYAVTVTDSKGCTTGLTYELPSWNEIVISEAITNVACRGELNGAIDITVNGGSGSGFIYSWTGPNGFTASTEDISGLKAGNYKITVTDVNSGCSLQKTITVTQPSNNLTVATTKTNVIDCDNLGTIAATASGGTSPYQYSLDGLTYQLSGSFIDLAGGSYTVYAKDINGCTISKVLSITDNGSDAYEGNNSKNNAKLININSPINARVAPAATDIDWFKFTTGPVIIDHSLMFSHPSLANYSFDLHNNSSVLINPASSSAGMKTYNNLAVNTTYYIKVTSTVSSLICYNLSVVTGALRTSKATIAETNISEIQQMKTTVFPNPHQGSFGIKIESTQDGVATVEILNSLGQRVAEKRLAVNKGGTSIANFTGMRYSVLFYRVRIGDEIKSGKVIGPN